jgi:metaxin
LLGDDKWFFGAEGPGLFDADIFAYTYLMDGDTLAWADISLNECLEGLENLRKHRQRLYKHCWGVNKS